MDHRNRLRTARLRSAIEFLTTLPLGTSHIQRTPLDSAASALASPPSAENSPHAAHAPLSTPAVGEVVLPIHGKEFRHVTSRGNRESSLFKRALIRDGILDGRIIFSRAKGHPSEVFSVIKYDAAKESDMMRDRQGGLLIDGVSAGDVPSWQRWKGKSFAALLHTEFSPCSCEREAVQVSAVIASARESAAAATGHPAPEPYDPMALDDPAIDREKQRFKFASEGVIVSVLAFRNERSIKEDINAKFALAHPWLDWGAAPLTLSKIRSLKKRALQVWFDRDWEVSTVALACVYFERLVFKKLVNKQNRRLAMASSLLLAFKMNESRENKAVTDRDVVNVLESAFEVPKKALLQAEFPVYVHLRFGLLVPPAFIAAHFDRLLAAKGTNAAEYLGAELAAYLLAGVDEAAALVAECEESHAARRRMSTSGAEDLVALVAEHSSDSPPLPT